MEKLKRTNKNIIKVLNDNGIAVKTDTAYRYFLEGNAGGKTVSIGCVNLSCLIHKGRLLAFYLPDIKERF
jgi:hypothetical protein